MHSLPNIRSLGEVGRGCRPQVESWLRGLGGLGGGGEECFMASYRKVLHASQEGGNHVG